MIASNDHDMGGAGNLEFVYRRERIRVEARGRDSVRLRVTPLSHFSPENKALLAPADAGNMAVRKEESGRGWVVRNGNLEVRLSLKDRSPQVTTHYGMEFVRVSDRKPLLRVEDTPRFRAGKGDYFRAELRCGARGGEKLYGLGQHPHGRLNQKGCVIDLRQKNTEVAIPWILSSEGYGLLWNHPGTGRVELAENGTRWTADAASEIDIWVTTGDTPSDILARYAEATGHAPVFPDWASGFWQCKLRYPSQEELLGVAREYKRRGLPLSVIVADYFHWDRMGEWRFDPVCWPDPSAMVRELREMGTELMVSVWPTVNPACGDFEEMERDNLLVQTERGVSAVTHFLDTYQQERLYLHHLDPTNPRAGAFHWRKIRENYRSHGIRIFWLDACEPELNPFDYDNLRYHAGPGEAVSCLFPQALQTIYAEGLRSDGEPVLTLCRSAWAGSQRYGAAVWSGDIPSTFESLAVQIRCGLNMAVSGIPWWCTDIGGFSGGDPDDEGFRELMVRWFQFGLFCPIFRLHGVRKPEGFQSGGPNEVWSFGDTAYGLICRMLRVREAMRPYIHRQMERTQTEGMPILRPLWLAYPEDPAAWEVEDQFLFGSDILVAPVTGAGATRRAVYLPAGTRWVSIPDGEEFEGGQHVRAAAPLDRIPLFCPRRAADTIRWLAEAWTCP